MDSLQIGYKAYQIQKLPSADMDGAMGRSIPFRSTPSLQIATEQNPAEEVNTTIHEVLHALFREYNIRMEREEEEHIVSVLGNGLTGIMVNNPGFFTELEGLLDDRTES